jgi:hypothetical protein
MNKGWLSSRLTACDKKVRVDEIFEWKISGRIQIPRGFKYIKFDVDSSWNLL